LNIAQTGRRFWRPSNFVPARCWCGNRRVHAWRRCESRRPTALADGAVV